MHRSARYTLQARFAWLISAAKVQVSVFRPASQPQSGRPTATNQVFSVIIQMSYKSVIGFCGADNAGIRFRVLLIAADIGIGRGFLQNVEFQFN